MDGEDAGASEFQDRLEALKSTWKSLFVRFVILFAEYQLFTGCIICVFIALAFSASATRVSGCLPSKRAQKIPLGFLLTSTFRNEVS